MASNLELKREFFYLVVRQLTCLKNCIAGTSLKPEEKRASYFILVSCLRSYAKEEKALAMLMNSVKEDAGISDDAIDTLLAGLIQEMEKYNLDSVLLSETEFALEDAACQYISLSGLPEKERCSVKATLAQERINFLAASRAILKKRYEISGIQNRMACVKDYIENIQRHFAVWAENSPLTGVDPDNIAIDLKHFDLSNIDFRGNRLQQIDFSDSRLEGCCLQATGISAAQLAKTIGFTRSIGLPINLIQQAQAILYSGWQERIKERILKLDNLNEEMARLDASLDNEKFLFLILKKCECLKELKARARMHASAEEIERPLLEDLTAEQRLSIESMLVITQEKGKIIRRALSDGIDKAKLFLLPQYLMTFQELMQKKNFVEILNKFNEVFPLLATEKEDDIIQSPYFNEVNNLRQRILDLELDCIQAMSLRLLENAEDSEKILTMVGNALEQFYAIMTSAGKEISSPQLIVKMHVTQQGYIRHYVEPKIKAGNLPDAEKRIEEIFGKNKELPYSAGDETPFIDLKNALKLNLIEKYIELGEWAAAQERIEKLVNECIENNCTLNLAGRAILANSQLWQGIIFKKSVICLDADQIESLSMEQQQQYHALFFETVKSGDLEQVKQGMQKFSWQVNIRNEAGYTAIITACWYGYEDIAKHLFAQGGDIVKIERFGETVNPLDGLVRNRYKEEPDRYKPIIVWLVENDLELTPDNALSLKDRDLFLNSLKILEYDIERKDKLKSLLITAIEEGEDIVVRAIAEHQTECLKSFPKEKHKKKFFSFLEDSTTRKKGLPLLHRACEAGHFQVVNTLLCLDEDLSADSKANKCAALIYLTEVFNQKYPAVDKDLYDRWRLIAQLLCGQGAQHTLYSWLIFHDNIEEAPQYLNQKNIHLPCDAMGNTPLHIAIRTRNLLLADWLIKEKAVLEVVNSNKELPLYIACCHGDVALVKLLLEAGASVDGPRRELTEAERKQLTDLSATFIEMQDFLSKKPLCLEKKTPLQQAVYCKKNEVVELLCLHGANVKENHNGNTPLHLAIRNKDVKSVQILLRYGANSLEPHHQKESALRAAVAIKHIPIIILLVDSYLNQYSDRINKDETIKWIATELGVGEIRQRFYDALIAWANDFGKEGSIQPTSVIQTAPRLPEATTSALTSSSSSLFSPIRYRNIAPHHQIVYHLSTNFYDEEGKESILLDSIGSDYEDQPELLPPEPMFYDPPSPQKRG